MRAKRWVVVAGLLTLACVEKGRSLVPIEVTKDPSVGAIAKACLVVLQGQTEVATREAAWTGTPSPLQLGVFVPKSVSGPVTVIGCGFDASGAGIAASEVPVSVSVTAGEATSIQSIVLIAGTPDAHCAACSSGTAGTGGTTGTAGSGGGMAGTGGTGGTAGTGGAVGGSGGTSGAGGSVGGTGGGTAGTGGGTAGTGGGTAGTGGSVGGTGGGRLPGWGGPKIVAAEPALNETNAVVAVDPAGNAVVLYQRSGELWSNRYTAATDSWGTPKGIDQRSGTAVQQAKIAVDKNGTYLAVWAQNPNAALRGIWQSTSTDGVNWTPLAAIVVGTAWDTAMAMNADGAAVVAWTESVSQQWQAAASTRAAPNEAWSAPTVMRPGDDNGDRTPSVAISGTGEAFVGWEQDDGGTADEISVWMRQHTTAGWTPAALFETYDSRASYTVSIAANKSGGAIATYLQVSANALTMQLWSRRYAPGTGFANPVMVAEGTDIDWTVAPGLTLDDAGNATVAWSFLIQSRWNVFTNRLAATATAWPTAMAMETDNAATDDDTNTVLDEVTSPYVGSDPAGNVTLIWRKRTGTRFDMYARRFSGGSWNTAMMLESRDPYSVLWPALSVGADGSAVAVWHYATELDVWANVFLR